ncbi:MAG: heme ABC exporter ATP-binding protein CcmA [Erythrobacter sp.]|nr:heme ABC exporter ATP-binding protein CcmA [Erythrobacter sp.]NCQ62721.1 heme ABC exporter ATP-binding protein CcmA [Alphaproteobacteria bacterium]
MQASALTARELFCRRGDRLLFGGIDLSLESGEALHLVGPNGIGKSSLLQILAGLRRPAFAPEMIPANRGRGSVNWQGSVGLIDERPALDEDAPLAKALGFWARVDNNEATSTDAAMDATGLTMLAAVPVRFLSTGQRKRAAFARLLIQGPDHWLLDEPLNGLDSDGVSLVERLIADRRAAGGAVIVASHQAISLPGCQIVDVRDHPW